MIASAASSPGMTDTRIAVRTPTTAMRARASRGPKIAPRLSIARSNPYARPYAPGGTTSASNAFRAGTLMPRAVHAPTRNTATCQMPVAAPIRLESTAVAVYPPTAVVRRRSGSSASAPPPSRAAPAAPSASPSINPSAAAGAPSVDVSRLGNSAVGTSWPTSDNRLARPMPATPCVSHFGCSSLLVSVSATPHVFKCRVLPRVGQAGCSDLAKRRASERVPTRDFRGLYHLIRFE